MLPVTKSCDLTQQIIFAWDAPVVIRSVLEVRVQIVGIRINDLGLTSVWWPLYCMTVSSANIKWSLTGVWSHIRVQSLIGLLLNSKIGGYIQHWS